MKLKSIKQVDLKNKRAIVRVDFNVPVIKGKVQDDFKIERALPTIKYLIKQKCKIVLISHFGRPEGRRVKSLSLVPVYKVLKKQLKGVDVKFKSGSATVLLLENIRYDKREDNNNPALAEELANLGDIFVNEAFAVSHRKTASTVGITRFLPSYAGLNFDNEVKYLNKALKPKKPAVALIGGAKVKTKFDVVENFLKTYSKVMVAGGVANTFLSAKGYKIGDSLIEMSKISKAKRLQVSKKIVLPRDVIISDKSMSKIIVKKIGRDKNLCNSDERILDIGPETIKLFSKHIREAKTIVWGGPMGLLEDEKFSHGTIALAKLIGARSSGQNIGVAGGGETTLAIEMSGMGRYYDFISTGGGAMLEFLAGKNLPGVKSLLK